MYHYYYVCVCWLFIELETKSFVSSITLYNIVSASTAILLNFVLSLLFMSIIETVAIYKHTSMFWCVCVFFFCCCCCLLIKLAVFLMKSSEFMNTAARACVHAPNSYIDTNSICSNITNFCALRNIFAAIGFYTRQIKPSAIDSLIRYSGSFFLSFCLILSLCSNAWWHCLCTRHFKFIIHKIHAHTAKQRKQIISQPSTCIIF